MASLYYSQLNVWAVVVAAAAYWILGSIWFSLLFGKIWSSELEKHGVKIQTPNGSRMAAKLVQTWGFRRQQSASPTRGRADRSSWR
ncbi:MAG: DUF1761 domain-containing protein [Ignavibacteria bacterium]|nr:MAG: DUF1761 domain-containing protein [Ignavibacteria bacterium]